jgi:hypothetical protein
VNVEFSFTQTGTYVFEVTVDAVKTTCKATLPLPKQPPAACDHPDVQLGLSGSMLPPAQHSIGGIRLPTTTANSITIRATRDGAVIAESTFSPSYKVTPGPNGPSCEPKECKLAQAKFP